MKFIRTSAKKYEVIPLHGQLAKVRKALGNGAWWTLKSLNKTIGGKEPSTSARIRDLRKPQYGGYVISKKRENNTYYYRMERAR